MRESLDEPISVIWYYNAKSRHLQPHRLNWNGQEYALGKVDFWHKTRQGDLLIHHFSISGWGMHSGGAHGAAEKRSKTYTEYGARASQVATQRSAGTNSGVAGSAGEQDIGVHVPEAYFKLALNTDTLQWTLEEYMTANDMILEYGRVT